MHRPAAVTRARWPLWCAVGLAACSSGGTGPDGSPSIGAVVVSGAPAGPLLIGTTVQLVATATNGSGGTVSNPTVTWKSSDDEIASVSSGGLATGRRAGPAAITATAGGKAGTVHLDVRLGGAVGPAGGSLSLPNGGLTLAIPANSLPQPVDFLVRPVVDPAQDPGLVPGTIYEIAPTVGFGAPAQLTIGYDPARLPAGATAVALQLYRLSNGTWGLTGGAALPGTTKVSGEISVSGTYAVGVTGVAQIDLGGAAAGAVYIGQQAAITATLYDGAGHPLSGRTVTWTSSDPTLAAVTGGVVSAIAAGTVTVTAESQGISAATTVAIITRPLADWSQAAEWRTFQGNPDHTGFVDATLDPVVFTERWSTTVEAGAALNPVTVGPGSVFASTQTYFGVQRAVGVSLPTGAEVWRKDFGAIHAVHPPAYAAGTVYLTTSGHEDSFLWAFDAATGATRFQSPYGNQWSTYYAPVVTGGRVYMAGGAYDGMYAFDAADGHEIWFVPTAQYNEWTPAVHDGVVYAYTGEYQPKVQAVNGTTGAVEYEIADPHFSWDGWSMNIAPVLGASNDLLATQAGRLLSFDLRARTVRWEQAAAFTGTPSVAGGVIYAINAGRLEARQESDGSPLWEWAPVAGTLQRTTVVTGNLIFATTETATYAVDLVARRHVWLYPAGGHLALSGQGVLLIAGADGRLHAVTVR